MKHTVSWSPESKETFGNTILYLEENWSRKEAVHFINRVYQVVDLISRHPRMFIYLPKYNAHRCVVVKQVSLFYRLKENQIELLTFWDNRMDPEKLKL
jgi:plasmid stabilization system protein ParE